MEPPGQLRATRWQSTALGKVSEWGVGLGVITRVRLFPLSRWEASVAGSSGQNRKECPASRSERKEARKPASKGGRAESLHAC